MDVILINPYVKEVEIYEHIGLGYIAAFLKKNNIKVKILDMHVNKGSLQQIKAEIQSLKPQLVGISIPFQDYAPQALDLAAQIKDLGDFHVTVGGIYPTFDYEEILLSNPKVNSIVLGEGEETFVELAEKILAEEEWRDIRNIAYWNNGEITKNDIRPLVKDLNSLPFPARDTLPEVLKELNFASMVTSRGCYGRCNFCSVIPFFSKFGAKYRMRSAENVVEEVKELYHQHGVRNIMFNDANYTCSEERAKKIAESIIEEGLQIKYSIECRANDVNIELFELLKKSGLRRVFIGIESGSQNVLDRMQKDTTVEENLRALEILGKLDIYVSMGFIMFDDQTTFQEINENMEFIQKAKELMPKGKLKNVYTASKLLPLAGTNFEKYLKEKKKYQGNSFKYNYRIDDGKIDFLQRCLMGINKGTNQVLKVFRVKNDWETKWMQQ